MTNKERTHGLLPCVRVAVTLRSAQKSNVAVRTY